MLGGSTAINIAGAIRLARDLGPGKTIVTILCRFRHALSVQAVQSGLPEGTQPAGPRNGWITGLDNDMTELVFRDDSYARSCAARVVAADARGIRLDRTVFYPNGGGQPGDTGVLRLDSGETIAIADTVKGEGADEVIHVPAPGAALPEPGAEVTAEIDWERRHRLMRMHTCLHLLCAVVPGCGDRRAGVRRARPARFRYAGREPRPRGDRRAPQCG